MLLVGHYDLKHPLVLWFLFQVLWKEKCSRNIVQRTLSGDKVAQCYKQCPGAAKELILNYITYFEERVVVC